MPRDQKPPEVTEKMKAAAAVTHSKLDDVRAWAGMLSQTRNAQKQSVAQGTKDAKEMLSI